MDVSWLWKGTTYWLATRQSPLLSLFRNLPRKLHLSVVSTVNFRLQFVCEFCLHCCWNNVHLIKPCKWFYLFTHMAQMSSQVNHTWQFWALGLAIKCWPKSQPLTQNTPARYLHEMRVIKLSSSTVYRWELLVRSRFLSPYPIVVVYVC